MAIQFAHRTEAGEELAQKLAAYAHRPDVLVLALPRGGVPVGFVIARTLQVPLDVFFSLTKKSATCLPAPRATARRHPAPRGNAEPDLAIGLVACAALPLAEGLVRVLRTVLKIDDICLDRGIGLSNRRGLLASDRPRYE